MHSPSRTSVVLLFLATLETSVEVGLAQAPLGTSFSYQGQLRDNGRTVTGSYDFQFELFDNAQNGNQVGATVTVEEIAVFNGLFATSLDFGQGIFLGSSLWLEISVRDGVSTGTFTTLSPRQQVTATPYALYAASAGDAGTLDSHAASDFLLTNGGNQASSLTVTGTLQVGTLQFADGTAQSTAFVGFPGTLIGTTTLSPVCFGTGSWTKAFSPPAGASYGLVYAFGGFGQQGQGCGLSGVIVNHQEAQIQCRDTGNVSQSVTFTLGWGTCSGSYLTGNGTQLNGSVLWYR